MFGQLALKLLLRDLSDRLELLEHLLESLEDRLADTPTPPGDCSRREPPSPGGTPNRAVGPPDAAA